MTKLELFDYYKNKGRVNRGESVDDAIARLTEMNRGYLPSDAQERVLDFLLVRGEVTHIRYLAGCCNTSRSVIRTLLLELEEKGLIREVETNKFVLL